MNMDFEDLKKLYFEKQKKYGDEKYKHISKLLNNEK